MKVVLRKDVPSLGKTGEVKEVADGYGRNYLIPRGLAAPATKTALQNVEARKAAAARHQTQLEGEHRALAQRIEATPLVIHAHSGEQGRLYGSVTSADIAEALSKALGQSVDKHQIELEEHIRHVGPHTARVHVAPHISATLKLTVEPER